MARIERFHVVVAQVGEELGQTNTVRGDEIP